jgi:hypothetical protein
MSTAVLAGSMTDSQPTRRIPAPANAQNAANGQNVTSNVPPIDIGAIQNLLHGVVLDHEDATTALNKLIQRALRACKLSRALQQQKGSSEN